MACRVAAKLNRQDAKSAKYAKKMGPTMERVAVVGCSGAGKSTFAKALAYKLDLEYMELDRLFQGPNWVMRSADEVRGELLEATQTERWVVDGNYSMVRDAIWPRATTIVWLDYSLATCFWRALKRTTARVWTRELLWGVNRETLRDSFLSRDSVLAWVVKTHGLLRKTLPKEFLQPEKSHLEVHRFRKPSEATKFLSSL